MTALAGGWALRVQLMQEQILSVACTRSFHTAHQLTLKLSEITYFCSRWIGVTFPATIARDFYNTQGEIQNEGVDCKRCRTQFPCFPNTWINPYLSDYLRRALFILEYFSGARHCPQSRVKGPSMTKKRIQKGFRMCLLCDTIFRLLISKDKKH